MPKEKFSHRLVGCLVTNCQRMAPAEIPLCATHWGQLPFFILGYLEASKRSNAAKWNHAIEWAADYLDMEELD